MNTKRNTPVKQLALLISGLTLAAHMAAAAPAQGIQTTQAGDRAKPLMPLNFAADDNSTVATITINPSATAQTIVGFGGAFTESAATVLNKLPANKRAEVLSAYFGPSAAAYTLCRTTIGSCDFSLGSYSYDESAGDKSLNSFTIDHDKTALIPMIKSALTLSGTSLQILASPWSPPAWMTTKGKMVAGQNHLKGEMYKPYADYLVKYIQAYAHEGIPVSYLTVQNESWNDSGQWETTQFQPKETVDFVKVLGPAFASNNIQTKIMVYDHNKGLDNKGNYQTKYYVDKVYSDGDAKKYIWGAGFHWYGQTQTDPFGDSKAVHEEFPDKHLLHTEACAEGGPHINDWAVGERYGYDIIGNLNNWTEGWIDWNLLLDNTGGPNHSHNLCSAPILADTNSGTLIYNPSYYYMYHISRFFRPGAVVISATSSDPNLLVAACKNPNGSFAVVVENKTANPIDYKIKIGAQSIKPNIPAHAIQTFTF